jgi:hypothetical protein
MATQIGETLGLPKLSGIADLPRTVAGSNRSSNSEISPTAEFASGSGTHILQRRRVRLCPRRNPMKQAMHQPNGDGCWGEH